MFESLADIDADGRLVPTLAQSWKRVDARTWEFHLRPGVRFQDGSPLTAEVQEWGTAQFRRGGL